VVSKVTGKFEKVKEVLGFETETSSRQLPKFRGNQLPLSSR